MTYILKVLLLISFSFNFNGDRNIVGGKKFKRNEFPFAVCIRLTEIGDTITDKNVCHYTGVLFNYYTVLTSCTCMFDRLPVTDMYGIRREIEKVELISGVAFDEKLEFRMKPWKFRPHTHCRIINERKFQMSYDYGVIITEEPFPNNNADLIKPIGLEYVFSTARLMKNTNDFIKHKVFCTTIGWGWDDVKNFGKENTKSKFLGKTNVKLIDNKECETAFYGETFVAKSSPMLKPEGKMCSTNNQEKDFCFGDGGALVCGGNVIAIASETESIMCSSRGLPNLYSRIDFISDWLKQNAYMGPSYKSSSIRHASQNFLTILVVLMLSTLTLKF